MLNHNKTDASQVKLWKPRVAIIIIAVASVRFLACASFLIQAYIIHSKFNLIEEFYMLLKLLEKLGRKRVISDRDGRLPYMYRYYLIFPDKTTDDENARPIPFNLMLHKICLSDPDDLHDHPWWYATLILKGGYWEITPKGKFWRGPGNFRISSPQSLHRIEIPKSSDGSWSLFFRGPKIRDWGFILNGKWTYHRDYLETRKLYQLN